jgi:ribosomal protein S24E
MEITNDNRNELFKRQELILTADSNLSFNEAKKQLAEQTKKPEENIDVFNVQGGFGKKTFKVQANVYDSKEDLDKIKQLQSTSKQRKEDKKAEAEPKAEDKPTEEPTTEAPAEEKTENEPSKETSAEEPPKKQPAESDNKKE